ncbi:FMN-binding negative transcriptional regulator [Chiayiivirga flava]|uniref:Transcriptional regulator n=1 Tax=Chiayiivirga flava TaxID=659595 RepID=A0A7W8FZY5_9GAMM|nr:FMN-binding negative transcriptional regulator [Chiayiivirga flava]MBB5208626.1 transcriptional regulator [Chiayiivirga flava]
MTYLPRSFAETDLAALDALLAQDSFVTLLSVDDSGAPFASHLPVLYRRDGDDVLIEGHHARSNPQVKHRGEVLMIVHGPHAYISPGWYADKLEAARVPTWNYAVAHLYGTLEPFDDEASLADLVDRLSQRFEASIGGDWRFDPGNEAERVQLRGIVGFRFRPQRIALKFKLNQNHPAANVRGAIDGLRRTGSEREQAVADLMQSRLHRRGS